MNFRGTYIQIKVLGYMTLLSGLLEQTWHQVDAAPWGDMTGPVLFCQLSGGAVSISLSPREIAAHLLAQI